MTDFDRYLEPPDVSNITCPMCEGTGKQPGNDIPRFCFLCQGDGEVHPQTARRYEIERNFELQTIKNQT